MAFRRGPNIVRDGLVFGYDADDRCSRFYKGEPTVNLLGSIQTSFNPLDLYTWASTGFYSVFTRDTSVQSPVGGVVLKQVSNSTDSYSNTYNNPYNNLAPASKNQTWTASVWAKSSVGTNIQIWLFEANSGGGYINAFIQSVTAIGSWQRIYITSTFTENNTAFVQARISCGTDGGIVFWDGLQVEQKPHPTQFVNGTRTTTQGLIDLTRNHVIDLSGMTYDSNAEPIFDGTSYCYITIPYSSDLKPSNGITLECFAKWDDFSGYHSLFQNGYLTNPLGVLAVFSDSSSRVRFEVSDVAEQTRYQEIISSKTMVPNRYYHVIALYNGTDIKIYIDGVQTASAPWPYGLGGNTESFYIGHAWPGKMKGKIPIVRLYNRALSDNEIQQNFNSNKNRFNI